MIRWDERWYDPTSGALTLCVLAPIQQALGWDWPMHDQQLKHIQMNWGYDASDDCQWGYMRGQLLLAGIPEVWL